MIMNEYFEPFYLLKVPLAHEKIFYCIVLDKNVCFIPM